MPETDFNFRKWASLGWALGVVGLSCVFAINVVHYQFGGYDLSPLIDVSWRYMQGQQPGVDFINALPPAFLALAKVASFFPFQWGSLTWLNAAYTCLIACLFWSRGPAYWNRPVLPWVVPFLLSLPLLYTNHIWYSSQAQLAASLFVFSIYASLSEVRNSSRLSSLGSALHLGVSTAFVIGVKPNLGLPIFIIGLILVILTKKSVKFWPLILSLGWGAGLGIACVTIYADLSIPSLLETYLINSGRAIPSLDQITSMVASSTNLMLIPAGIAGGAILLAIRPELFATPHLAFLLLTQAIAFIPIITDWDSKVNNITLPLLILSLLVSQVHVGGSLALRVSSDTKRRTKKMLAIAIAVSFLTATWGGLSRDRMRGVGPFWENSTCCEISGGYFDGLKTGPWFNELHSELLSVHEDYGDKKVFFGPRVEFAYSLLGFKSPKGLPLFWFSGTSYSPTDEPRVLQAFRENNFEVLVFSTGDYTRFPDSLRKEMELSYTKVDSSKTLEIWLLD